MNEDGNMNDQDDYVPVSQLANDIGRDRSTVHKMLKRRDDIEVVMKRTLDSGNQTTAHISKDDYDRLLEERKDFYQPQEAGGPGVFYMIAVWPGLPAYKFGFTTDMAGRAASHRTMAPQLEVVKTWPCGKDMELAALKAVDKVAVARIGPEMFELDYEDMVLERLDRLFDLIGD